MTQDSEKKIHHFSVLTMFGGDLQRCVKLLEIIACSLAEKSVDVLVVHKHEHDAAGKARTSMFFDSPYDTVFLNTVDTADGEPGEGSEKMDILLSQHALSYDLLIFCEIDIASSEEIRIFAGKEPQNSPLIIFKGDDDPAPVVAGLYNWLYEQLLTIPVWGCLLIGGKSTRMGRPKHLIEDANGITWGEKIAGTLSRVTERVVLSGGGEIPTSLAHLERLNDIADAQGPLAGILAAMRWNPHVSFIVAACDMPGIQEDSLGWLLGRRSPGIWGTVPLHPQSKRFEPLLAYYDYRSRVLFEKLLQKGSLRPNHICKADKIETPMVPFSFAQSWRNCNTPADLLTS